MRRLVESRPQPPNQRPSRQATTLPSASQLSRLLTLFAPEAPAAFTMTGTLPDVAGNTAPTTP